MSRAMNWDAENRRKRAAASYGSPDGEGARVDPAWVYQTGTAKVVAVPALYRFTDQQKAVMQPHALALKAAAGHITAARKFQRANQLKKARAEAHQAWAIIRPLMKSQRATGKKQGRQIADLLLLPFQNLAQKGVDVGVPGGPGTAPPARARGAAAQNAPAAKAASCAVCRLELTPADRAARRSRHADCD